MKLAILALALAGCASLPPPPVGYFSCGWARFHDFQNRLPHPRMPRMADLRCPRDWTAVEVASAASSAPAPAPAPAR